MGLLPDGMEPVLILLTFAQPASAATTASAQTDLESLEAVWRVFFVLPIDDPVSVRFSPPNILSAR